MHRTHGTARRIERVSRAGRALLAFVTALALVLCALGWWMSGSRSAGARPIEAPTAAHGASTPTLTTLEPKSLADRTPPERSAEATSPDSAEQAQPRPSVGSVLVRATLADGGAVGGPWTLDVEDLSMVLRGETAARERIEVAGNETSVARRLREVHRFRARARGLVSGTRTVVLGALDPTAVVDLVLEPALVVSGRVLDDDAQPSAGRLVWLRPAFDPASKTEPEMDLEAITQSSGEFRFEQVPHGTWSVLVGPRASPLARRTNVTVTDADVSLDPIRLPKLYSLSLRVVDRDGVPIRDARVSSSGSEGGTFDATTDATGVARVGDLPAGRYRVFAQSGWRRANLNVVVPSARPDDAVILTLRGVP